MASKSLRPHTEYMARYMLDHRGSCPEGHEPTQDEADLYTRLAAERRLDQARLWPAERHHEWEMGR